MKNEFIKSWAQTEEYFKNQVLYEDFSGLEYPNNSRLILRLIEELRDKGYDIFLRAGFQMSGLVLSRSKKHGLEFGQPWVRIFYDSNDIMNIEHENIIDNQRTNLKSNKKQLITLINLLKEKPIS